MGITAEAGRFVHVVAEVDLADRTGEILYVNPVARGMVDSGDIDSEVELDLRDADGGSIRRLSVEVRRDACNLKEPRGMIEADVPFSGALRAIVLLLYGQEVSRYQPAPLSDSAAPAIEAGVMEADSGALRVSVGDMWPPAAGLSYTIQASDDQGASWTTLAVGCKSPRTDVDLIQFSGARAVKLRVLETNGFEDRELLVKDVTLGD